MMDLDYEIPDDDCICVKCGKFSISAAEDGVCDDCADEEEHLAPLTKENLTHER